MLAAAPSEAIGIAAWVKAHGGDGLVAKSLLDGRDYLRKLAASMEQIYAEESAAVSPHRRAAGDIDAIIARTVEAKADE